MRACSSARRTRTTGASSSSRRPTAGTSLRTETVQARNDVLAHELDGLSPEEAAALQTALPVIEQLAARLKERA